MYIQPLFLSWIYKYIEDTHKSRYLFYYLNDPTHVDVVTSLHIRLYEIK